ncbi:MAG TPA: ferritin-like domain-containing protein [Polyangiaceae bacterium]
MRNNPLLLAILGALAGCSETFRDTGCMEVPAEQTTCKSEASVEPGDLFLPNKCGDDLEISEVLGPGKRGTTNLETGSKETCCYPVEVVDHDPDAECMVGRPYFEDGTARSAPLRSRAPAPASARAVAWANAGRGEHASIAAFARLALQLLRHGAPAELLRGVHQAALDEIRHSEVCWSLSERFGAGAVTAGDFPFAGPVAVDISLAELAAAAVREGCLAETLGAHVTDVAARRASDPFVREALRSIADEEATHAVLSFRIVAWALAVGGDDVMAAVRTALRKPWPRLDVAELALRANVDAAELRAAASEGVRDVLEPAVARLLAS